MLLLLSLGDQGGGGGGLVLPGGWQDALGLVVASETVDSRLGQNKTEFRIAILAVPLQMLSDGDGLLDHVIKILGNFRRQALRLQDSKHFRTGDEFHLSDAVGITKDDADLRGRQTL